MPHILFLFFPLRLSDSIASSAINDSSSIGEKFLGGRQTGNKRKGAKTQRRQGNKLNTEGNTEELENLISHLTKILSLPLNC